MGRKKHLHVSEKTGPSFSKNIYLFFYKHVPVSGPLQKEPEPPYELPKYFFNRLRDIWI